ncbi:tail completion protein gp17 [Andreprevotia chitinilytica]|uniref:tail completion protein gp17 n=1 Tax=Andreprevotia chitinilytica TaxID=396808 RepID=UPI00068B5ED0|nr:DUF3168 domain-containing protein [Andreprevotia chitinilytica]
MNRLTELVTMLQAVVGEHVYPEVAPEGTPTPYATWQVISEIPENRLAGGASAWTFRIQVNIWAGEYAQARSLIDEFIGALPPAWMIEFRSASPAGDATLYGQLVAVAALDI